MAKDNYQNLIDSGLSFNDEVASFDLAEQKFVAGLFELGFVKDQRLYMLLTTDKAHAFVSFNTLIVQLSVLIIFSVILAFIAAFFVSKSVTKPLTSLMKIAENIQKGDYSNSLPESSTREVDSLSLALNTMQHSIEEREVEINQLAYFDKLTELPNRNHFVSQLNKVIAEHQQQGLTLAVLQLDLDRFKEVNDTLGHAFGDKLLKVVAKRLQTFVYPNAFIAHFAADEFGLILPDIDVQQLDSVIGQFEKLFTLPFSVDDVALDVDASFGVSLYPEHGDTSGKLLQCTDIAMHACKGKHVHHVMYYQQLNKHSLLRLSLMSELRSAINDDQLELFYQPKLDLKQ
jgi:diguanylate cyclase (GGDEF)-like protein